MGRKTYEEFRSGKVVSKIQIWQRGSTMEETHTLLTQFSFLLQHPIYVNCHHQTAVEADVVWRQAEGVGGLGGNWSVDTDQTVPVKA